MKTKQRNTRIVTMAICRRVIAAGLNNPALPAMKAAARMTQTPAKAAAAFTLGR